MKIDQYRVESRSWVTTLILRFETLRNNSLPKTRNLMMRYTVMSKCLKFQVQLTNRHRLRSLVIFRDFLLEILHAWTCACLRMTAAVISDRRSTESTPWSCSFRHGFTQYDLWRLTTSVIRHPKLLTGCDLLTRKTVYIWWIAGTALRGVMMKCIKVLVQELQKHLWTNVVSVFEQQ